MESFDWKISIRVNIFLLRSMGLWPKGDEVYKMNFYTLYAIFANIIIMGGHNFFQTMNIFFVYNNLQALASTIFITVTDLLTSLKVYFFVQNIGQLKKLMITLNSAMFQPRNLRQIDLVQPRLKIWKTMYFPYSMAVGTTVSVWSIIPFLNHSYKEKQLPFLAWYPYDSKISPFYEITYFYQVIGIWFLAIANVNMDTLTAALMTYIGAQCDILCDDLKNLGNLNFNKQLLDIVQHHKEIVRFAENTNKYFSMIVLGQFFTSTIVLALTMFQMTLVPPLSSASFSHIIYVIAITFQLFLYCWFGNEIDLKSSQIPYSAFESDWTGIPLEAKKNLIIFIIRTQRPIKMSAINLFSLSLATFTTILRTSWSYFAVLRRVNAPA